MASTMTERRKKLGYTQLTLAQKLGVRQGTISRYETGERKLTLDMAMRMSKVLKCKPERLLDDD